MKTDDIKRMVRDISEAHKMRAMAVASLREADWPRWRSIDPDFQPDYDHWLRRIESAIREFEAQGVRVVKVDVDVDEFLIWATVSNGGRVDSQTRAAFAVTTFRHMDAD